MVPKRAAVSFWIYPKDALNAITLAFALVPVNLCKFASFELLAMIQNSQTLLKVFAFRI